MSPWKKLLLTAVALSALLVVGTAAAAVYAVHAIATRPWVEIHVEAHGGARQSVHVTVPSALVGAALAAAPHLMPPDARCELDAALAEHEQWRPLLHQLAADLADIPDATLVEIEDHGDHVRIHKRGAMLYIEIRNAEESVDVTLPADLARQAVRAFS